MCPVRSPGEKERKKWFFRVVSFALFGLLGVVPEWSEIHAHEG